LGQTASHAAGSVGGSVWAVLSALISLAAVPRAEDSRNR